MLLDIRYAFRIFVQSPGFALVTVLVLALGIGANTAIFSIVNAALIRPLPYDQAERLVSLFETRRGGHSMHVAGPNFRDWRDRADAFDGLAAYYFGPTSISGGKEPERVQAAGVSRGFFGVMGAHPILGRTFLPEEERQGGPLVAVIGEAFWRRSFGASPSALGQAITTEGRKYTIVGVVPEQFDFPRLTEIWAPMFIESDTTDRTAHNFLVVGRLRPGVAFERAKAEMGSIMESLEQQYPQSNKDLRARLVPLQQQAAAGIRPTLILLLGSVGFVLLIACINVANLLLARAASRRREIAVRSALGAGTGRLLRQLLTESLLLSLAGGLLGLLLAGWTNQSIASLIPAGMLPVSGVSLDARVLVFAIGASLLTGLLFGIAPALMATRVDVNEGLKAASRAVAGGMGTRLRNGLIAFEIALSFVLLVGAGLTTKSLLVLQNVDPGFDSRNVVVGDLSFPSARFEDIMPYAQSNKPMPAVLVEAINRPARLYERLIDQLKGTRGVIAAGATSEVPFVNFGRNGGFDIEGRPNSGGMKEANYLEYTLVSEDYFRVMGIKLKRGRFFEPSDRQAPNLAIVNEATAKKFFVDQDPLGQRIQFAGFEIHPQWLTIVGVVADTRSANLSSEPAMASYVPFYQNPLLAADLSLVVKAVPAAPVAAGLRSAIREINNETPIKISSMETITRESVATPRLRTLLIGLFAAFALGLAAIGIYGVISNTVNQRVQEIGVRMALGAGPHQVLKMLLAQACLLTAIGLGAGLTASLALTRLLRSFLYEVSPNDPWTFAVLAVVLSAIGLLAGLAPAWRAARLDPVTALREE